MLCFVYEPPECQSDWECPKRQKCCQGLCGIKCTDPVDTSKSGEEVQSWKGGSGRSELEDMLLGQVKGARLNWGAGWDRVRASPPPLPALFSQVDSRPVGEPVSQQVSQFMNSLSDTRMSDTGWGPVGGRESSLGHSPASDWILKLGKNQFPCMG